MITNDAAASLAINPTEHVKSINCLSYDGNALMMDGVSLADIAKTFGTPTYVYSQQAILAAYKAYDDSFAEIDHQICYAVKANSNLAVLNELAKAGSGFDIVTGGELARVWRQVVTPKKSYFQDLAKPPKISAVPLK